ncbi:HTTM domain-containing protein [Halorubrum sp. AD140]|uniref:HTTM domain-containing protein n=1 Tax=Halorubrum sp. AD140 TaxID=3050073 RepID=UPI002ACD18D7|nr:HTTM domain-containing protein [Halorubrum sp. AD140]MDZ5812765.1 HTTM domain-containing protein [Halorubrum sp. AD140]
MDERRGPATDAPDDPASRAGGKSNGRPPFRRRLRAALRTRLGVDLRALAAFRVALGVVLLLDLALRARNLGAFYTDAGALPRSVLAEGYPVAARLSLHALSGEAWAVAPLFLAAAVAAVALAVGHRTRLATAASLVLLASLQARNPYVLNAGDTLLWQLLGAGLFCPLGARWSVDAARRRARSAGAEGAPREGGRGRFVGPVSALLLAVAVAVYVSNAVEKLRGTAWTGGEAVGQVFRLTHLHGPLGDAVPEAPALLAAATYGWLALLVASPLLVAAAGRLRAALAATLLAAHLSMALTLQIGVFPLVSATALLPFFPPFVWDRVEGVTGPAGDRLRRFAAARLDDHARNGGSPDRGTRGRVVAAVAAILLVSLLAWNAAALGVVDPPEPAAAAAPTESDWNMFAPNPSSTETLVLATATTADGDRTDALYGDPVATDRPPSDARAYPTARWRKALTLLAADGDPSRVDALLAHLCDRAAGFADDEVESVTVSSVEIDVTEDGETRVSELGTRECRSG